MEKPTSLSLLPPVDPDIEPYLAGSHSERIRMQFKNSHHANAWGLDFSSKTGTSYLGSEETAQLGEKGVLPESSIRLRASRAARRYDLEEAPPPSPRITSKRKFFWGTIIALLAGTLGPYAIHPPLSPREEAIVKDTIKKWGGNAQANIISHACNTTYSWMNSATECRAVELLEGRDRSATYVNHELLCSVEEKGKCSAREKTFTSQVNEDEQTIIKAKATEWAKENEISNYYQAQCSPIAINNLVRCQIETLVNQNRINDKKITILCQVPSKKDTNCAEPNAFHPKKP